MTLPATTETALHLDHLSLEQWAPAMQQRLQERLQATQLEVLDESHQHAGHAGSNGKGFGTHFRVRIASPLFTNMPRVARHRLVYDALQDFLDHGAHALAIELL